MRKKVVLLYCFFICLFIFQNAICQISNEFKITASDGGYKDQFGYSVSISGEYAVVGAHYEDEKGTNAGAVYVFKRENNGWIQMKKITAMDGDDWDCFGESVSLSENLIIIGADYSGNFYDKPGYAYIFNRNGSDWVQMEKKYGENSYDHFGQSVSLSGDIAVIGAPAYFSNDGKAYTLENQGGNWVEVASMGDNSAYESHFGVSVSVSGNYMIIGADKYGSSGAAYIYKKENNNWIFDTRINGESDDDYFGNSVCIADNYAIIGAPHYSDNQGAIYIYKYQNNRWEQLSKINGFSKGDFFGETVSISKDFAIVSAYGENNGKGAVYIYKHAGTMWEPLDKRYGNDSKDGFGNSLAISNNYIIVGAFSDNGKDDQAGAAYIYELAEQQPELTIDDIIPSDTQTKDWGESVTYDIFVKNNQDTYVEGAIVHVQDGLQGINITTNPTDVNGKTTYTTAVPPGKVDGTYDISFVAKKDEYEDSQTETRRVTVSHNTIAEVDLSAMIGGSQDCPIPFPQNEYAFKIEIRNESDQVYRNIKVSITVNDQVMDLYDKDGTKFDGIFSECPGGEWCDDIYAISKDFHQTNSTNDLARVKVTSVDGTVIGQIIAEDIVSLYFAKHPTEDRPFQLGKDNYKFPNYDNFSLAEFISYLGDNLDSFVHKNPIIAYFAFVTQWSGRCFGMSYTAGNYFQNPGYKPLSGYPYDWSKENPQIAGIIKDAHLSQLIDLIGGFEFDNEKAYEDLLENFENQKSSILCMEEHDNRGSGRHAILATSMIVFHDQKKAYPIVYEVNDEYQYVPKFAEYSTQNDRFRYNDDFTKSFIKSIRDLPEFDNNTFNFVLKSIGQDIVNKNMFLFAIACPANIYIQNAQGEKFGYLDNGSFINEIQGATVERYPTNESTDDSLTLIYAPVKNNNYVAKINGHAAGNLRFEYYEANEDDGLTTAVKHDINITSQAVCEFDNTKISTIKVDSNGDGTFESEYEIEVENWSDEDNNILHVTNDYPTITAALNSAKHGDKIEVEPGIYQESIILRKGVKLYSTSGPNLTILKNSGVHSIVRTAQDACIQGFTITDNYNGENAAGIGVYSDGDNAGIDHCIIVNNNTGIYLNNGSKALILNNTIDNNHAGIFMQLEPSPYIINNIITNSIDGGIYRLTNKQGNPVIMYNIYFGNEIDYECYDDYISPFPGDGEIYADPLFVGGNPFDYHLKNNSPCINAGIGGQIDVGDTSFVVSYDSDGSRPELGAFSDNIISAINFQQSIRPLNYDLKPVYPNPFNPFAKIQYTINKKGYVQLFIFNSKGQTITEMVSSIQEPGNYEFTWDASMLPSGLYLVQLAIGNFKQVRKCLLLK